VRIKRGAGFSGCYLFFLIALTVLAWLSVEFWKQVNLITVYILYSFLLVILILFHGFEIVIEK
jgi:hypothetical protein